MTQYRKKLIEVALPLDAINDASAEERAVPRRGHPSTLHLWWARRPLATARGILFAQLVDDPSAWPNQFTTEAAQAQERERLFGLMRKLVQWDNTANEELLYQARLEIARNHARMEKERAEHERGMITEPLVLMRNPTPDELAEYLTRELPTLHDPFAGGGSIPVEAQRLGLNVLATDLNPVAMLLNRAQIEMPAQLIDHKMVTPSAQDSLVSPPVGMPAFAADLKHFGDRVLHHASKRVGHLYKEVPIPDELGGDVGKPMAWLWARTVPSPDPAFSGCHTPLVSNFVLSEKGDRAAYVTIELDDTGRSWQSVVVQGKAPDVAKAKSGTKAGRGAFRCVFSGTPITSKYIRGQGATGNLGLRLLACVVLRGRNRFYLTPTREAEQDALTAKATWEPDTELPEKALGFRVQEYGIKRHADLFLPRQLAALSALADGIDEVREEAERAARDGTSPVDPELYGRAVATYLSFALGKQADWLSMYCAFIYGYEKFGHTFGKQTLSMVWDFAELSPFSDAVGNWMNHVEWVAGAAAAVPPGRGGVARLQDAARLVADESPGDTVREIYCTDPPYYDNIGYADLSDFFYVWLRRTLATVHPDCFRTMLVPKGEELVASPARFDGDADAARKHFEEGLHSAFRGMRQHTDPSYPVTIYYAFKQQESKRSKGSGTSTSSTGWEAMLQALIDAGFEITGTWPVRSERLARLRSLGSNALASSIVLVCRPRRPQAHAVTRGEFRRLLGDELPAALRALKGGNVAPVDVAQASIGPGMAIFSRHTQVVEADGTPMTVRDALGLINTALDEFMGEQEADLDRDSRFAVTWFEDHGYASGPFGKAETLAKARNVSVGGVVEAGILHSGGGQVRLLTRDELPDDWDPATDKRLTVWEATQHLIKRLEAEGETAAAGLLANLGPLGRPARDLAYRLYNVCERQKRAEEGRAYNGLVVAWPELEKLARSLGPRGPAQQKMFE